MRTAVLLHVVRDHGLLGGFVAWALHPLLGKEAAVLFWVATVLMDLDHYVSFVARCGIRSVFQVRKMFLFHQLLFERAAEKGFLTMDPLHTLEVLAFITGAGIFWPLPWLRAMAYGFWLHFVTDLVHLARHGRSFARANSFLEYWIRRRRLAEEGVSPECVYQEVLNRLR